ncbi:DUF1810 domain-containing protein [Pedobacter sp. N23S346]|uniref:DUF1810 domain-containing protein n=1 Tax=Pedobacter sp. N23S346 TaxID=3402750 RepID=UPI003AC6C9AD
METNTLERFLKAQDANYADAFAEISNGRKTTHWMWYVFPQLSGLGKSEMAKYYSIANSQEAKEYLKHPVLGKRLEEISSALLKHQDKSAYAILGSPDDLKLQSSMTLFSSLEDAPTVFKEILHHFYSDQIDSATVKLLESER